MSNICYEFSKFATSYGDHSIIQQIVAKKLVDEGEKYNKILDIGCGDGSIYKSIDYNIEHFIGVDFSSNMLSLHPHGEDIELIEGDFNSTSLFTTLKTKEFDVIFSASALQWSKDLDFTLLQISQLKKPVSLAIFTSNTFKKLYDIAHLKPILKSSDDIIAISNKYFDAKYEILNYTLTFDSPLEALRYIKKSGVSGDRNLLGFREMKKLLNSKELKNLEFEIVLIRG